MEFFELNAETVQSKTKIWALTLDQLILKMMRKFITRKLKWVALFQQTLTPKEKKKKSVKNFLMLHNHTIGILVMSHFKSEFSCQFLASMAFPTLFPDGKGDPTKQYHFKY